MSVRCLRWLFVIVVVLVFSAACSSPEVQKAVQLDAKHQNILRLFSVMKNDANGSKFPGFVHTMQEAKGDIALNGATYNIHFYTLSMASARLVLTRTEGEMVMTIESATNGQIIKCTAQKGGASIGQDWHPMYPDPMGIGRLWRKRHEEWLAEINTWLDQNFPQPGASPVPTASPNVSPAVPLPVPTPAAKNA